ncbi:MAG: S1 RNA-binding domain-containing protein [Anaerolineae bacterium]
MTTRSPHFDPPPPPDLEEGYWAALLSEGEFASGTAPDWSVLPVHDDPDDEPVPLPAAHPSAGEIPQHSDWDILREMQTTDETIEMSVVGCNRGGVLVEWGTLRGFVPASQLIDFPAVPNLVQRQKALNARMGQTLHVRIIELDEDNNRLIFSERAARAMPGERAGILTRVHPGDVVTGIITNLCDFGAFVDLGGLEGLIHISEMSWGRVGHPADLLKRGDSVEAFVLDVHPDAGRIALSLKRLRPDPWETVHLRYRVGETVTGTITNVVDFGAFARIEEGLEGLIHVSELAEGQFLHPRNVVSEGQHIQARILHIDGRARRLGLTLRENSEP